MTTNDEPRCPVHLIENEHDDGAFFCIDCDESAATGVQYEVVNNHDGLVWSGVPSYEEAVKLIEGSRRTDLFIVEVTREFVPLPESDGSSTTDQGGQS